jgi:hypothetical protein
VIVAEFIASQRTGFGVPHAIACRALEVSQSWFYKWINRAPTVRAQRCERLDEQIQRLFTASGDTYGSPRITRVSTACEFFTRRRQRDLHEADGRFLRTPWQRGWSNSAWPGGRPSGGGR